MSAIAYRLREEELVFTAIRAQGAGGQNVNKVSTALQLRFDIVASSLPEALKARLLAWPDQRIGSDGVIVLKAQRFRSQAQNRADAIVRLDALIAAAAELPQARRATRPTRASKLRRLEGKQRRGHLKHTRGKVGPDAW